MYSAKGITSHLIMLCMVLLFISPSAFAAGYQTTLSSWDYVMSGANYLDASDYSVPTVYDWNGDGKFDLLVGQTNAGNGYISYYQNYGTATSPAFNGFSYIQACTTTCNPLNVTGSG